MAILKMVNKSPRSTRRVGSLINYIMQDKKVSDFKTYNFSAWNSKEMREGMELTKRLFNKQGGNQYYHMVIGFKEKNLKDDQMIKVSDEFLKHNIFKGYEVIAATHKDTEHQHMHLIINSVNSKTGEKFRMWKHELNDLKLHLTEVVKSMGIEYTPMPDKSNDINIEIDEDGYVVDKKFSKIKPNFHNKDYWVRERGELSWTERIAKTIQEIRANEEITSIDEFEDELLKNNISIRHGKYMTYIDLERQKQDKKKHRIRDKTLNKNFGLNINRQLLEEEFKENEIRKSIEFEEKEQYQYGNGGSYQSSEKYDREFGERELDFNEIDRILQEFRTDDVGKTQESQRDRETSREENGICSSSRDKIKRIDREFGERRNAVREARKRNSNKRRKDRGIDL